MTRDDIVKMASDAGFDVDGYTIRTWAAQKDITPDLQRFAALVAEAEREKCKQLYEMSDEHIRNVIQASVEAERARYRTILEDALYALEYASDMTKPTDMQGCTCPICVMGPKLRELLKEDQLHVTNGRDT